MFEKKLQRYAELIVQHGLHVPPGHVVNIGTEAVHRDLACLIAEECYKVGAKYVNLNLSDIRLSRIRVTKAKEEDLTYVPSYITEKYKDMVDDCAANLKLGCG